MTRMQLVGELERLYDRQFGCGEVVSAGWVGAREIYALLGLRAKDVANSDFSGEVGNDAALKAARADEPTPFSWVAGVRFGGERRDHAADDKRHELCQGLLVSLLEAFELDAARFALDLCRPCFDQGGVEFSSGRDKPAKKRLDALKRLASELDQVEEGQYCADVHWIVGDYGLLRGRDADENAAPDSIANRVASDTATAALKFVAFSCGDGENVAVPVDSVAFVRERKGETFIVLKGMLGTFFDTDGTFAVNFDDAADAEAFVKDMGDEPLTGKGAIFVAESFNDVVSRLNTAAGKGTK